LAGRSLLGRLGPRRLLIGGGGGHGHPRGSAAWAYSHSH